MKEKFRDRNFKDQSLDVIAKTNKVIDEYAAQGFDLSVRQIHYQFVSRNWYRNTAENYEALAKVISEARIAGLIDWDFIRDRGRPTIRKSTYKDLKAYLQKLNESFLIDHWADQENYVEVMIEKQSLEGVVLPTCERFNVAFTSNKGYSSSSTMYERAKFMQSQRDVEGKKVHVLYGSDHDASGRDMVRDIKERLELYSDGHIEMHNFALTIEQVHRMDLPENPVKLKDSRSDAYIAEFGTSTWELDAIDPTTLSGMIEHKIRSLIDAKAWDASERRLLGFQDQLQTIIDDIG